MPLNERQESIVKLLQKKKRASVKFLSAHFYVSEMTVRRDLKALETQGLIQRYSGGALYTEDDVYLPIETRRSLHVKEKELLSREAKKYLFDFAFVYIDSSSTCSHLIPLLSEYRGITLISNSVRNILLASRFNIKCLLVGGFYYPHDMCTVGSYANELLLNINPDIAFFTTCGISDDGIISDMDENQTAVRKTVMKNSSKNIFLFDSTKKNKKYVHTLCRAEDADAVIMI